MSTWLLISVHNSERHLRGPPMTAWLHSPFSVFARQLLNKDRILRVLLFTQAIKKEKK